MKSDRLMVAGNWKMHTNYAEGKALAQQIVELLQPTQVKVIFGSPYIQLNAISAVIKDISNLHLAAQNVHQDVKGAFTGEISAGMLQSVGVEYVIVGHSERRAYFNETDDLIYEKVKRVIEHNMRPIFCCGERIEVRDANEHQELVADQIKTALFDLSADHFRHCVVAYEPVWAIGTGHTATPAQAQEMHAHLRRLISERYGEEIANNTTILYGGSVKPNNAKELFAQPDVDGGLVGGASLKARDFVDIINSFS